MPQEDRLQKMETKIDAIYASTEKTRKYFLITMWITVIFFVVPLIAMVFVIPKVMSGYLDSISGNFDGLGGL